MPKINNKKLNDTPFYEEIFAEMFAFYMINNKLNTTKNNNIFKKVLSGISK